MRIITATVAVAAAVLVPAGFGQSGSPDDRPGIHGIGPSPVVVQASDDRTFVRGTGPPGRLVGAARRPELRPSHRAWRLRRDPRVAADHDRQHDDGFHWGDAGIGLGIGIALMFLAAGAIVTLRRAVTRWRISRRGRCSGGLLGPPSTSVRP